MDLWWPSHDIFTGTYAPDVGASISANLPEIESDFAANFPNLPALQSPFENADRNERFSASVAGSHMDAQGV